MKTIDNPPVADWDARNSGRTTWMLKEVLNSIAEGGTSHIVFVKNDSCLPPTVRQLESIMDDHGIKYETSRFQTRVTVGESVIRFELLSHPPECIRCSRQSGIYFDHPCDCSPELFKCLQHVTPMILVKDEYI